MTYKEKQSVSIIIASLLAVAAYGVVAVQNGYLTLAPSNVSGLAWALIVFVIFQVVFQVVAQILLAIVEAGAREIRKQKAEADFDKLDEREKLIDARGERYSGYLHLGLIFASVVWIALYGDIRLLFVAIGLGGVVAAIFGEGLKLYYSRRGL